MRVSIITISDSVSTGHREDGSGKTLAQRCRELCWEVISTSVVPDEEALIRAQLLTLADAGKLDLILTTGGTGLGPRDVTPEATASVANRLVPGLAERMRQIGAEKNPRAALARGVAAIRGTTLIVNLPGSPRGAVESFDAIAELLPHAVAVLHGAGHD
ncbi:MAG TPA: MogA/MoaB family molybdenum cofactor biosynthesis protein [Candidatus Limnocylindrales bacterium]|nr:MogA/MoaB family molybdenum cofactor biosynthesis protein [Candidatus Limnocylindrales bacterium]